MTKTRSNFLSVKARLDSARPNQVLFRVFNIDRNSLFALNIDKKRLPFVRFYKKKQVKHPSQYALKELGSESTIVNMVIDLASEDVSSVFYEQDI